MADVVLSLEMSTMGGSKSLFELKANGERKVNNNGVLVDAPAMDMDKFWATWEDTIEKIVAEKVEGWDQIRIYASMTCRPIYDFVVKTRDGRQREFGIYSTPAKGAKLEGGGVLPDHYVDIFAFMRSTDNV